MDAFSSRERAGRILGAAEAFNPGFAKSTAPWGHRSHWGAAGFRSAAGLLREGPPVIGLRPDHGPGCGESEPGGIGARVNRGQGG